MGKEYQSNVKKAGRPPSEKYPQGGDVSKGRTVEKVAESHGVGTTTVERSRDFAISIDKIAKESPAAKQAILSGKVNITKQLQ